MTILTVVCVILIQGFLVAAFPTSDGDGDPGVSIELPVYGMTEFHGTVPATGTVAIIGHAPCNDPELPASLNPNSPSHILPKAVEKEDASTFTEFDEISPPKHQGYDEINNDQIPKKVILGAILADSIMAEKGAEIDAKLAELDAFVESELGAIGPIIQSALSNADTLEIDSNIDSALLEMGSQISSQLTTLDEFLESELNKTEELVESVIRNVEEETKENRDVKFAHTESAENFALRGLELAMLESFVESTLEKTESLVESELEKVNALVESELKKIDSVVESQLDKVDLFIEKELEKTDAVVKSEMSKIESLVEYEMAKVTNSMEEIADCGTAGSNAVFIISNLDGHNMEQTNEDQVPTVLIDGTFPVSGRTLIIGSTGCPPPFPTGEPLPLYVESFPVFENVDDESQIPVAVSEDIVYGDIDDGCTIELPVAGKAVFTGVAPATGTCKILGTFSCDPSLPSINSDLSPPIIGDANPKIPLKQAPRPYYGPYFTISENNEENAGTDFVIYHKDQLPIVKILRNRLSQKPLGIVVKGDVEFSGNAEAVGSTGLRVDFPCPPLTATEVGPDGKKYIWIAKKPCNKDTSSKQDQPPKPKPEFPSYTDDFPETVIMDASKNYEKHINKELDVDFGLLGSLPVALATV